MSNIPKKGECASDNVVQDVIVKMEDPYQSDASNTPDGDINCESAMYEEGNVKVVEAEEGEIDDVGMAQTSENIENDPKETQTAVGGKKQKKKNKKKPAPAADEDDADYEPPQRFEEHPYKTYLDQYRPTPYDLQKQRKYPLIPMMEASCEWVDTEELLDKLADRLMRESEIGLAIRYNTNKYNSHLCLMLISTKDTNYMIDTNTTKMRKHLHVLNPVFLNPDVIKVVDGNRLLRNLQVDHNMWFVNIFDLKLAFKRLGMKISYMQYVEVNYDVGKKVSLFLSNWHTRPLPEVFKKVAFMLMHFLIPVYIELKNQLIDSRLIWPFLNVCNKECALVFQTKLGLQDIMPDLAYLQANQAAALCELHAWRDRVGRQKRRNVDTVMHNGHLQMLARNLPTRPRQILKIAKSAQVQYHLQDIQRILMWCKKVIGPVNKPPGWVDHDPSNMNYEQFQNPRGIQFGRREGDSTTQGWIDRGTFKKNKHFQNRKANRFGSREDDSFENRRDRFDNRLNRRSPDHRKLSSKGSRGRFMDRDDEPSSKKDSWNSHRRRSRDRSRSPTRSPERQRSSSTYMLVSSKGESFPVEDADMLANLLGNSRTQSTQRHDSSGDRRQNKSRDNGNDQYSTGSLDSIKTLLNMSSALMKLNKRSSTNDSLSRSANMGNASFIPDQDNWPSNSSTEQGDVREIPHPLATPAVDMDYMPRASSHTTSQGYYADSYPNPSQRSQLAFNPDKLRVLDMVSFPDQSRSPGIVVRTGQSQRSDEDLYKSRRSDEHSYPNQAQRSDMVSYNDQSRRPDVSYPKESQGSVMVSYPEQSRTSGIVSNPIQEQIANLLLQIQSQRSDVISHPSESQSSKMVSYPDWSRGPDVSTFSAQSGRSNLVSYPNQSQSTDVVSDRDRSPSPYRFSHSDQSRNLNVVSQTSESPISKMVSYPDRSRSPNVNPHSSRLERSDLVSYPNQSRSANAVSHREESLSPYRLSYSDQSRKLDMVSHPSESQSSQMVSYHDRPRSPNVNTYSARSGRSDLVSYPNQSRGGNASSHRSRSPYTGSYPDQPQSSEMVSYSDREGKSNLVSYPNAVSNRNRSRSPYTVSYPDQSRSSKMAAYPDRSRSPDVSTHSSRSGRSDLVSYPNQSRSANASSHRNRSRSPYTVSRTDLSRSSKLVSYHDRSQSPDISAHSSRSGRSDLVSYPIQSQGTYARQYRNRSRSPHTISHSDESQKFNVVSYPKYDPSRYSKQGF